MCINGTQTCFTRDAYGPTQRRRSLQAAPATPFTYVVSSPGCAPTATDCLRANTPYECSATAVKADGIRSLESQKKGFTMEPDRCELQRGQGCPCTLHMHLLLHSAVGAGGANAQR